MEVVIEAGAGLVAEQRTHNSMTETENEIKLLQHKPSRELIAYEIRRPKKLTKQPVRFLDRTAESFEFRAYKDNNFKAIRDADIGIQVAPQMTDSNAQTTWFRSINKAVQYEAPKPEVEPQDGDKKDDLLAFLERVTVKVETALQQNEAVDIFHETFRMAGDDDVQEGTLAADELREVKNFADPTYSKSKVLACIDWLPRVNGMVAVSAVRNVSFDQRVSASGQTSVSYILLWDFRQLVKPQLLMQSYHDVFTFRFNRSKPGLVAGGCITGQVMLWDISIPLTSLTKKLSSHSSRKMNQKQVEGDDDEIKLAPILPKYISNIDHSHKKCVADLLWLPPNTQINYRGQLVGQEHLDANSYQFVTVAGDGLVMVWDIRFEAIAMDELKHIGRSKHVPQEKSTSKDGAQRALWGPIFKSHLKKMEGVGELSLCKACSSSTLPTAISSESSLLGDIRSHLMVSTEEGDVIFADLCGGKSNNSDNTSVKEEKEKDEEEDSESSREYVRWISSDHSRPCVGLQQSPFFPDILLSVGDWSFHIWRIGEDVPLFVSPQSSSYLTAGAWSPSRPAVLFVACVTGNVRVWDFTDTSFRPSIILKAAHFKITSMEFLKSSNSTAKQQLLAAGDESGTLHIFEMPKSLVKPAHKEAIIMSAFLDRERERAQYMKDSAVEDAASAISATHYDTQIFHILNPETLAPSTESKQSDAPAASEEAHRIELELIKKEDSDFEVTEALFMQSLGLESLSNTHFSRP